MTTSRWFNRLVLENDGLIEHDVKADVLGVHLHAPPRQTAQQTLTAGVGRPGVLVATSRARGWSTMDDAASAAWTGRRSDACKLQQVGQV